MDRIQHSLDYTPPNIAIYKLTWLSKIRDLDGDGIDEIAVGSPDAVMVINGRNGGLIWKIQSSTVHALKTLSKGDADRVKTRAEVVVSAVE